MPDLQPKAALHQLDAYRPDFGSSTAGTVIRLSANEGALGPSPKAVAAMQQVADMHRYPSQVNADLTRTIADTTGLDAARILPANGSDELIQLLATAYLTPGDEAIITQYGFLMFRQATLIADGVLVEAKDDGLTASVDNILGCLSDRTKMIFLANPNNPTGTVLARDEIKRLVAHVPAHILVVLDSAYAEYCAADADYSDGAEFVDSNANVVMLRTFSKIYGLAGLRLGWGYFPKAVYDVLAKMRSAFSVNMAAAAAGVAAMADKDFTAKALAHNSRWMAQIQNSLTQAGFKPLPSVTNFFLIRFADAKAAAAAYDFLVERGILLRRMGVYDLADYLRMSIGSDADMAKVMAAFKDLADAAHAGGRA